MAKKPNVNIRAPGADPEPAEAPEKPQKEGPKDDRIALTVKLSPQDYARLYTVKGRRRQPVQQILEEAVRQLLRDEGA